MRKEKENKDLGEEWLPEKASKAIFKKNKKLYEELAKE